MIEENELATEAAEASKEREPSDTGAPKRRYPWAMIVVAVLFVLVAFFSWYGSWFGRALSDAQIESYLQDRDKPRNAQHALSFIGNRIIEGDASIQRWYPQVIAASQHEVPEVRRIAAWAMGQDNRNEEFHQALLVLLKDANAGVRHNAALQLIRFNDASGREELRQMLEPVTLKAERDGVVEFLISEEGVAIAANTPLLRVKDGQGQTIEMRAQENARLQSLVAENNSAVRAGETLLILSPSVEQAFEALKGLFLIGQAEDIPLVQRYTGQATGMSDAVQKQAVATLQAIRARSAGQAN